MRTKTTSIIARAEALCEKRQTRLTLLRRRVLQVVCGYRLPPTAYDILRTLGRETQPPTVYRALNFLQEQGILHKIRSRGVFAVCGHPESNCACCFLLCTQCGSCNECCDSQLQNRIVRAATADNFIVRHITLEIEGLCNRCNSIQQKLKSKTKVKLESKIKTKTKLNLQKAAKIVTKKAAKKIVKKTAKKRIKASAKKTAK